jgi:predicted membrane channel-forming protein YqfA (hemolysin III family)
MLAVFCIAATLTPHFDHPRLRPWRAATYGCLGFSSISPIIHGLFLYGWTVQKSRMGLLWILFMTALNLIGVAIYVYRVFAHIDMLSPFLTCLTDTGTMVSCKVRHIREQPPTVPLYGYICRACPYVWPIGCI